MTSRDTRSTVPDAPSHDTPRGEDPDLSPAALHWLAGTFVAGLGLAAISAVAVESARPTAALREPLAAIGAILLLLPAGFSMVKRSGRAERTRAWFSAHALASVVGAILVTAHATAGDLLSPPGLLWALVLVVVAQGLGARILLPRHTAALFASRVDSFAAPDPAVREQLRAVIAEKRALLERLDPDADEALFSPNLRHGTRHPWLTLNYALLAAREARLVGRRRAGLVLAFWRRSHIVLAYCLVLGVLVHVTLALFFAGYVADGGPIDWWHITAWGGP